MNTVTKVVRREIPLSLLDAFVGTEIVADTIRYYPEDEYGAGVIELPVPATLTGKLGLHEAVLTYNSGGLMLIIGVDENGISTYFECLPDGDLYDYLEKLYRNVSKTEN